MKLQKNNKKIKRILGMITVFGSLLGVGIGTTGSVQADSQPELVTVADTKQKLFADILNMINIYGSLGDLGHIYDYTKDALINAKNKGIITDSEFNREFGNLADFKNSFYDGQNLPELLGRVSSLSDAPDNFGKYILAFQKVSKQVNSSWNNFWDVTSDNCESMLFAAICLAQEYYIADDQAREQATKVRQQAIKFAIRVFEKYQYQEPLKKYRSVMSLIYVLAGQQRKSRDLTSFVQSEIDRNNTQLTDIQRSMDSKSDKLYHSAKIHQQLASLYDLFSQINYAQHTETYAVNIKRIFSRYEHAEMLGVMAEIAFRNAQDHHLSIKQNYQQAQKYCNERIDCLMNFWPTLGNLDDSIKNSDPDLSKLEKNLANLIRESQIKSQVIDKQLTIDQIFNSSEPNLSSVAKLVNEMKEMITKMAKISNYPQSIVIEWRKILDKDKAKLAGLAKKIVKDKHDVIDQIFQSLEASSVRSLSQADGLIAEIDTIINVITGISDHSPQIEKVITECRDLLDQDKIKLAQKKQIKLFQEKISAKQSAIERIFQSPEPNLSRVTKLVNKINGMITKLAKISDHSLQVTQFITQYRELLAGDKIKLLQKEIGAKQSSIKQFLNLSGAESADNLKHVTDLIAEIEKIINEMIKISNDNQEYIDQCRNFLNEIDKNSNYPQSIITEWRKVMAEGQKKLEDASKILSYRAANVAKTGKKLGEGGESGVYQNNYDSNTVVRLSKKETPTETKAQVTVNELRTKMENLNHREKELSNQEKTATAQTREEIAQEKAKIVESRKELGLRAAKADQERLKEISQDVQQRSAISPKDSMLWRLFAKGNPAIMSEQPIIVRGDVTYDATGKVVGFEKTRFAYLMRKGKCDADQAFCSLKIDWNERSELTKDMIFDLLSGLVAMNEARVVHLDIKPGNFVLVRDEKTNRLMLCYIDFDSVQQDGLPISNSWGTLGYIAPERLLRFVPIANSKLDVYSLGTSLISMLLQDQKYMFDGMEEEGQSETDFMEKVIADVKKEGGQINKNQQEAIRKLMLRHINPALVALLAKMVAFDPINRPTPQECIAKFKDIQSVYQNEATVTAVTSDTSDPKKNQYSISITNHDYKYEIKAETTILDLIRYVEGNWDGIAKIKGDIFGVAIINSDGSVARKFRTEDETELNKTLADHGVNLQEGQTIRVIHKFQAFKHVKTKPSKLKNRSI